MALSEHRVWDLSQRIFHWVNFLAVLALAAIGLVILNADRLGVPADPGMVGLKTLHVWVGYVFLLNLLWRIVWAFVGGPYARWRALLPLGPGFGAGLLRFVRGFAAGRAPFYLGHNPVARIMLSLLMLLLVVQATTGIVLAATDVYMPPFGGAVREWVAADTHDPALVRPYAPETVNEAAYAQMRSFRKPFVTIHEFNFYLLMALVIIHVTAAVLGETREGGAVITAMFTGRKIHDGVPADAGSDLALRKRRIVA